MGPLGQCISRASFGSVDALAYSAWFEHAPFAFWLIDSHRPKVLVELGTHLGFSYFCFCQQVEKSNLPTRCFAIDTWRGDAHAGFYGEDVFNNVRDYHDPRYAGFSRLIRSTFDAAIADFADSSIDLLHVDGRHRYEDVRHDFETWQPKLSPRAIVLFHDTQEREQDFGVYRYWQEVSRGLPRFEFIHGHGLGVLAAGREAAALPLFAAANDADTTEAIQEAYARLGFTVTLNWEVLAQRAARQPVKRSAPSYQITLSP